MSGVYGTNARRSTVTNAQWVVTDPTNLASGIINSANEIIQTSSTVSNVVKNFNEVKKVYDQGKEYYDKLKAINNLVKDARKVQQTVLLVGDVSEMYVQNFGKMMNDQISHHRNWLLLAMVIRHYSMKVLNC